MRFAPRARCWWTMSIRGRASRRHASPRAAGVMVDDRPRSRDAVHRGADSHGVASDPVGASAAGSHRRGGPGTGAAQAARVEPGLLTVTVGERGAVALDGDRFVHVNGFPVQAVDTTGSGDVFRGAFIAGLLQGLPTAELLRFANAAAAVSCTKAGALDGVPTRSRSPDTAAIKGYSCQACDTLVCQGLCIPAPTSTAPGSIPRPARSRATSIPPTPRM